MKMTRLEWRYLQRIALDHPYYDTHKPPLSDAEARAIMEANNMMTGREFVDSIYAKLGMTRPVKEKRRLAWLSNIGELFAVPPIRKIAIAILVVLLMTVFFAATPTGRAIAESVIQYFVTLFDDGSLAVKQSNSEQIITPTENDDNIESEQQDGKVSSVYINSIEEFTEVTGRIPIVLPMKCIELYYVYEPDIDYLELHSKYETIDGIIVAYQIWGVEDLVTTASEGYTAYETDDSTFYSIEENGDIIIRKILEDSYFGLISKGSFTLDNLVNSMKY